MRDARGDNPVGGKIFQILSCVDDGSRIGDKAGDRLQNGGFSRAVGSDQRDDFALRNLNGHAMKGLYAFVGNAKAGNGQKQIGSGHGAASSPR